MRRFVGLGYIGLPTSLFFAKNVFKVHGTDINKETIYNLKSKLLPFKELGLQE
jgi:UDP-N-acetyl-D-mannosaminuronic acid dehydrogenase